MTPMIPWREINSAALATITPREEQVLRWYYGLGTDKKKTWEIAAYLHVTPGRINQIVKKAHRKLEHRFTTEGTRGCGICMAHRGHLHARECPEGEGEI